MRRFLIAGNWKMHKGVAETSSFIEALLAASLPADGQSTATLTAANVTNRMPLYAS